MEDEVKTHDCKYEVSQLDRRRTNVLDAISIVAKGTVATTLVMDIDMKWAEDLINYFETRGKKLTVTAILIKAIAIAQIQYPAARSFVLPGGRVLTLSDITAGFTVERLIDDTPSVFFGTIYDPVGKSLDRIMDELQAYGDEPIETHPELSKQLRLSHLPAPVRHLILRAGLCLPQLRLKISKATFGLTSLGKFGIGSLSGPTITTSCFGVGTVEDRPVVEKGAVVIKPMLTLSYFFDHRLIDGGPAARFLNDIRELLQGGLGTHLTTGELPKLMINSSSRFRELSNEQRQSA